MNENHGAVVEYTGIGVALGVAFGAAFDNVGIGLALGITIGAAIGLIIQGREGQRMNEFPHTIGDFHV